MSWSTSELRVRLAPLNRFKPSSKIFYWPFQGGTSFVDLLCFFSVLRLLCFVRVCLYVLCGHLLGKGWPLGSRLWCLLWVWHFPIGILGQVWYLIVSIPDLCTLTYLGGSYGRRRVCYIRKGHNGPSKLKFVKRESFAPGFMAWAEVSFHGKNEIRIIPKVVKVNSQFYIDKVLKPFIKHDAPRMFPGDQIKDMVFHQDSALSHTSKQTLAYMRIQNMNFVTPQEWMPKSPDAAPMNVAIWGILKRSLHKRKIYTLAGLKRALRGEWRKLEQHVINKTLESWPKRCRLIYNLHGSQIEHLLQWIVLYVKFIDKIKLFQNSWITSRNTDKLQLNPYTPSVFLWNISQ